MVIALYIGLSTTRFCISCIYLFYILSYFLSSVNIFRKKVGRSLFPKSLKSLYLSHFFNLPILLIKPTDFFHKHNFPVPRRFISTLWHPTLYFSSTQTRTNIETFALSPNLILFNSSRIIQCSDNLLIECFIITHLQVLISRKIHF